MTTKRIQLGRTIDLRYNSRRYLKDVQYAHAQHCRRDILCLDSDQTLRGVHSTVLVPFRASSEKIVTSPKMICQRLTADQLISLTLLSVA